MSNILHFTDLAVGDTLVHREWGVCEVTRIGSEGKGSKKGLTLSVRPLGEEQGRRLIPAAVPKYLRSLSTAAEIDQALVIVGSGQAGPSGSWGQRLVNGTAADWASVVHDGAASHDREIMTAVSKAHSLLAREIATVLGNDLSDAVQLIDQRLGTKKSTPSLKMAVEPMPVVTPAAKAAPVPAPRQHVVKVKPPAEPVLKRPIVKSSIEPEVRLLRIRRKSVPETKPPPVTLTPVPAAAVTARGGSPPPDRRALEEARESILRQMRALPQHAEAKRRQLGGTARDLLRQIRDLD